MDRNGSDDRLIFLYGITFGVITLFGFIWIGWDISSSAFVALLTGAGKASFFGIYVHCAGDIARRRGIAPLEIAYLRPSLFVILILFETALIYAVFVIMPTLEVNYFTWTLCFMSPFILTPIMAIAFIEAIRIFILC